MKVKWETIPLGLLCSIKSGKSDTKDAVEDGAYAFFDRSRTIKRSSRYLYDCEALIIPGEGTEFLPKHFIGKFDLHQRAYALSGFSDRIDVKFLYYFLHHLHDYFPRVAVGATVKSLRLRHFEQLPVAVTSLSEQQRVVGILDTAFDGIATAIANAEKNLRHAREIFESYLQSVFSQHRPTWVEKRLSDVAKDFGRGRSRHRPRNEPKLYGGKYPFIQTGDVRNCEHLITSYSQTYSEDGLAQSKLWPKGTLCITIAANIAETGILDFDACFPDSVIGVIVDERLTSNKFLEYLLQSHKSRLQAQGKGSAQDNINLGTFENRTFPFPSLKVQAELVTALDSLREEIQHLESIYLQKLAALDELKKSLLHQAFSGELTRSPTEVVAIPFSATVPNITTTDLHAGILSIAYRRHEERGRQKTFGRVKGEKIASMIEAHLGIDLGRNPVKDAAGPNDYPHLKSVESRARKAGFFVFEGTATTGYRLVKRPGFDGLIEKTRLALGERNHDVDDLLELMLPMDTQQTEIFATVYAAWNNLLLDGRPVTDETIVLEARENWHPDKLKIPRENFFKAIEWMRVEQVVPNGSGKRVGSKSKAKK